VPSGLIRRARQVATDPVLRRWLVGRALGRLPPPPRFAAHRPPYLDGLPPLAEEEPRPPAPFAEMPEASPTAPVVLPLPGLQLRLEPGDERRVFDRAFADTETLLALHRFAWLPLLGDAAESAWVQALWRAWRARFGAAAGGWPWHPYTAAERAVNVLRFARRRGLPPPGGDAVRALAAHAPAIAGRLEYFGEHDTSNHLSNNGRGLYLLGRARGLEKAANLGLKIVIEEAPRIFAPSGILREGSSHYHLLLARNYVECWLSARAHAKPEEAALRAIARRALASVPPLVLPGGLPLVGDVSPDCPPAHLAGLRGAAGGWIDLLDGEDRAAFEGLRRQAGAAPLETLRADGWLRADFPPWSGLWHAAPGGFPPMPGHGHQDTGGFELHYGDEAVFVDPGRGAYGETGDAARYRSAGAHNTLLIDGRDPYPPNRPYYDEGYRRAIGGPPPEQTRIGDGVMVRHHGFSRLAGVGAVTRRWRFSERTATIEDTVDGTSRRSLSRRLHTPLAVERSSGGLTLRGRSVRLRLSAPDADVRLDPATRWTAYGEGAPATCIAVEATARLPWSGILTVEALG
jgi:hypothetical protein